MPPQTPPNQNPASPQTNLEDVLFQQGILKQEQLSAIKLESINTGASTEKIILDHSYATTEEVAKARAQLLGVPFVRLEGAGIAPDVLNLIPEAVARRYKLIPFRRDGAFIWVAMADPLDMQLTEFIEKKSGHQIKRYLALSDDILKAITEQYSQNLTTDVASALKEVSEATESLKTDEVDRTEVIREAPVTNIVTQLLEYAVKSRASDIILNRRKTRLGSVTVLTEFCMKKLFCPKKSMMRFYPG